MSLLSSVITSTKDFANSACAGVCHGEHLGRNLTHLGIGAALLAIAPFDGGIPSLLGGVGETESSMHSIMRDGSRDIAVHPEHKII